LEVDRCSPTNSKNDVEKKEKCAMANSRKVDVVKVDAEIVKGLPGGSLFDYDM
jgi:hypothetical protein